MSTLSRHAALRSAPRLFVEDDLAEGAEVAGPPGAGRYLGSVLRRGPGDAVRLFNGRDGEFAASVAAIRKDDARLAVGRRVRAQRASPDLRLVLALLKREAMEWAVEKAAELGASAVHPVLVERCVADRANLARLALVAREAAEQCERLDVPRIAEAAPLHALLDGWDAAVPLFVAAERAAAPSLARAASGRLPPAALLVGPEGGFTGAELDALRRRAFVAPVALGPRILRAETAVAAGLAVLGAALGDLAEDRAMA